MGLSLLANRCQVENYPKCAPISSGGLLAGFGDHTQKQTARKQSDVPRVFEVYPYFFTAAKQAFTSIVANMESCVQARPVRSSLNYYILGSRKIPIRHIFSWVIVYFSYMLIWYVRISNNYI